MITYEDDCVDCGLPCFSSCKYKNFPHYYCDCCGEEAQLYEFENEQLCINCIIDRLDKIN